jgi:hypothetical protein
MRNYALILIMAVAVVAVGSCCAFAQEECKTYCDECFQAACEQDGKVQQLAGGLSQGLWVAKNEYKLDVADLSKRMSAAYPKYMKSQKTLGIARLIYDVADCADIEGFTFETAARVATKAKDILDGVEIELNKIGQELSERIENAENPDKDV